MSETEIPPVTHSEISFLNRKSGDFSVRDRLSEKHRLSAIFLSDLFLGGLSGSGSHKAFIFILCVTILILFNILENILLILIFMENNSFNFVLGDTHTIKHNINGFRFLQYEYNRDMSLNFEIKQYRGQI